MKNAWTLLALLATAALLLPWTAVAADTAANVVALRGKAVLEREANESALKVRAALRESDAVRTMERSRLKMLFRNDSIMTLGSSSRLILRQYLVEADARRADSIFELADGKMRGVVGSGAFKVLTPTAYAAARGTVFVIWFDAVSNTTGIAVVEGGLEIRNIRHSAERGIILTAGQMSLISGNDGPTPPEPFSFDMPGGGAEHSHWENVLEELEDLGDASGDGTIEDIDPTDGVEPPEDNGTDGNGGTNGNDGPVDPPPIEPPIDQEPPPLPATAPITVEPVFP